MENGIYYINKIIVLRRLAIIKAVFALLMLLSFGCKDQINLHGTLITAIVTPSKVYLLSDGRVISRNDHSVYNDFSKVHQINNLTGMLTAGEYMPKLQSDVIDNCKSLGVKYVDDVAKVVRDIVKKYLEMNEAAMEDSLKMYHLSKFRSFVIIAGYDSENKPRLFYMDTNSDFEVNEHVLFRNGRNIEIAINPLPEDAKGDASQIIMGYLKARNSIINSGNIDGFIKSAFDSAKSTFAKSSESIGGKTFFSTISLADGYQKIY